jgi:hypothetical protein
VAAGVISPAAPFGRTTVAALLEDQKKSEEPLSAQSTQDSGKAKTVEVRIARKKTLASSLLITSSETSGVSKKCE